MIVRTLPVMNKRRLYMLVKLKHYAIHIILMTKSEITLIYLCNKTNKNKNLMTNFNLATNFRVC